jgi:hypothetical protein
MAKAMTVVDQKVVFQNEKSIGLGTRIIIKTFVKTLSKIARPLLVSITAQILISALSTENEVSDFLNDVLEEIDPVKN